MLVTCNPPAFVRSLLPLYAKNLPLDVVMSYKYLMVKFTIDLSSSPNIQAMDLRKGATLVQTSILRY